ncbi:MAX dimerization protein MGA a isoform X3 [Toxotes jaculatrix]|uniref:MAX dimerization protein MGA a isoform X3 n=1 Tax=Toxotes jaculatrix TaxID=941984 RepID=UPI001B3AE93F|nr:MAX dimerization protein MGA a isoform X3 [Toxotes jaculatrix]
MASKKEKAMVFHHEGEPTPVAAPAPNHPPPCFAVPKPGKASESGMERNTHATSEEADMMGKPNIYSSKKATMTSGGLSAMKHSTSSNPHSDNLSPDSICKGIRVTLDNNSMWNEFFRCKTEMILTKQGSRMFPYCRFRISGLQPFRKYSLIMDIYPLDNSCYKWTGKSWQVAGKAECHEKSQPFAHPESPSMGQHWMQNPVSFYKMKLTNNISDEEGNTILHPMHRYLPRLHVVQTDKAAKDIKLNGPGVVTFTFPQTEFMAVTAYQNSRFVKLKVDYNPFAKGLKEDGSSSWGLKLKLKDSHKDGGTTTNDQHPVKKSLKSLLANHKPRSSKAVDSKSLASGDLQKNSTADKDQSTAKVPWETSCSSLPAQKLFSELIREAHVSLQRCNLEQLGINSNTSHRTELANTKTTALKSNREDVPKKDSLSVKTDSETSPAKNDTVLTKRKIKEDKHLLNSLNFKDNVVADDSEVSNVVASPVVSQNSPVESEHQSKPEAPSEVNVRQHKRPAPVPLPALALFLKQHSTKSRKAKNKPSSLPPALPSESLSKSQSSARAPACLPSDNAGKATGPLKDLTGDVTKSDNQASGHTCADFQAVETTLQPPSPSCQNAVATTEPEGQRTDDRLISLSVAESPSSELAVPDGTPVLPYLDQPFSTPGTSTSTISSTLATSSAFPVLSPPLDTVLTAMNSPQKPTFTEPSTLPSGSPTIKCDSLLSDPECSFGFEPLSPASSPEPLPPLPASLALELNSTTSEPTPKTVPPEEPQQAEDFAASVFKWHTVLPPPEPYIDTSFTTFQLTSQTLPLGSVKSPLLSSSTPSHSEPQTLDTSTSTPPPDGTPSFQENEQSLPFPAELSPLALQLPLSPTFSSLDGDGLSPTPSITDLVHFFSTDDDLGMGVEFSNTEAVVLTCPPLTTAEASASGPFHQVQPTPANKPPKRKKKSRRRKLAKMDSDQKIDHSNYTSMQPNLEEVEEQLFISFTSKEALKLHIADTSEGTVTQSQTTPEGHLLQSADTPENAESLEQRISACEKILLRDLKLMKHKQVIHPVLQQVGLKMNLLDPTLAIDLQYLGVCLPIPPPGFPPELLSQKLPLSQGVSTAFVSRTGKTTDVTQIKGWREKFSPSEAPSAPSSSKPEAGPSTDLPKKNLSAFCSDMLDEYLENEGKLIDERAASFSQPLVEPVMYELPTRSTSYVRTLSSVLKKHTASSPTPDLISGFIPPSKRPKLSLKGTKMSRTGERKQKGPKQTKLRPEPEPSPAEPNLIPKQPGIHSPAAPPPSDHTEPFTEPHKSKKNQLKVRFSHTEPLTRSPQTSPFKKRRKLKPKTSSQTLSPSRSMAPLLDVSEDLAPLESDSELGTGADVGGETQRDSGPVMTRALLRQKDLEDGVVWEGRPRTSITEERAVIALTSLFTLMGFVSENPTAPIQLIRRRAPPCLNEFCRLGCVCSSLSHCSRISHCGRPHCMFGCSCLKQKVVLLKNLDGSDSSPSHHESTKRRRRRRRMKMAYILKEAESVSQPSEQVRILWKKDDRDSHPDPDPDPVHVPEPACLLRSTESRENKSSCARVRGYRGKKKNPKQKETIKHVRSKAVQLSPLKQRDLTLKETKTRTSSPPPDEPAQPAPFSQSPPPELTPKPSKRLIILAECKWASDADRNHVLKKLCEAMAQDRLDDPFWIRKYLISPVSQTVEDSGSDHCIQYKIHISRPRVEREKAAAPPKPAQQGNQGKEKPQQQDHLGQANGEAEPLKAWPRKVMEVEEPLEDWQREVEEEDIQEEAGSTLHQVDDGRERSGGKMKMKATKKKKVIMALPFLTGISPAGFLSANRKQPGGTDHLVQVNGKLYPLAKIQLGKMGALHPANRLAAYLTGRVGPSRDQQGSSSSSSSSSKPCETQSSAPTPQTISASSNLTAATATTTATPPRPWPPVTMLTLQTSPTVLQPAALRVDQSAASCELPAGEAPQGVGTRVVTVRVYPSPAGGGGQVRAAPAACGSSAPSTASQVSSSVIGGANLCLGSAPTEASHMWIQFPGPHMKVPVSGVASRLPPPRSNSQGMVLQPVRTASGVQYYRRPDGKLVQLVPISQLRPVKPNLPVGRALPPSSLRTPAVAVVNQTPSQTSVTTPSCSSSSSLSSLRSLSVPPVPVPLCPSSGFLSQKDTCTFKILPTKSNKEPIIITCPKPPPQKPIKVVTAPGCFTLLQPPPNPPAIPVNLVSLRPSTGQGAELGVKKVAVSGVPGGPTKVLVPQKPASSQTSTTSQTHAEKTHRAPPPPAPSGSEVTPVPPPNPRAQPELACDLVDVDIICVDHKMGLVTTETQSVEVVDPTGSSSGETENSSDFGDELYSEEEKETITANHRHIHNVLERQRRLRMLQLFNGLRREVGLSEKRTSKIFTLKKAVQMIQELRTTETELKKKKRRLMKRRDQYLSTIAPTTDKSPQVMSGESVTNQRQGTGRTQRADLMDVDLLDRTDELMDDSSDEDRVYAEAGVAAEEGEGQSVAVETAEENRALSVDQRRLERKMKNSENSLSVKTTGGAQNIAAAFRALSSVLNTKNSSKRLLLEQARQQIHTLQTEVQRLKSVKTLLKQQRDAYVTEISHVSGKSRQRILRKLQHLSSKQMKMEKQERRPTANQLSAAAGGGASDLPAGRTADGAIITTSSNLQQQTPPVPPTPVSPLLTITHVQTPVHQPQRVPQVLKPIMAPPSVSHKAAVVRDRPRTIPNILSRSKNPAPSSPLLTTTVEGEAPPFQALAPVEVLSLVGAPLPGHLVRTLSPLMVGPTVCQTSPAPGMAPVTLNVPGLTKQQIHPTSLPRPPTGKIYSSSAPLTITDLTAANFSNLLDLVRPATTQELQQPQAATAQQLQIQPRQVPAAQPAPPPHQAVSAGSDLSSDRINEQDRALSLTDSSPEALSSSPPSNQSPSSSVRPGLSADGHVEVGVGGPLVPERQLQTRGDGESESLTSLLNELVFLNQQTVSTATKARVSEGDDAVGGATEQARASSPWLLQLDSDSDDAVTMEMGKEHTESGPETGQANGSTEGCVLAPPPLLQMKVGGAKGADPASRDVAAEGGGDGGQGRVEGGTAWRPMPRLVPLGLRGNPSS